MRLVLARYRDDMLRWHSWIARSPPKGQVGGSNPLRSAIEFGLIMALTTVIPTKAVGPIKLVTGGVNSDLLVPMATLETPLWASVNRGARVSRGCGGIVVTLVQELMTRSVLLEAANAAEALSIVRQLPSEKNAMNQVVAATSRYAQLRDWQVQLIGRQIYLRFSFATGAAAGHNMATKAAEALQDYLLVRYPRLNYVSISGNYCVDKKNSAVNGILGRGKYVIADGIIPRGFCERILRVTPEKLIELNVKKNLLGSIVAGSVRTANAHFANMLLAVYLATGQDAANIVEGSQGFTTAELQDGALYFAVTLPNLILGTVGKNHQLPWVNDNLRIINGLKPDDAEFNARLLAEACAAVVWCGELSLLAAQAEPGCLVRSHLALER